MMAEYYPEKQKAFRILNSRRQNICKRCSHIIPRDTPVICKIGHSKDVYHIKCQFQVFREQRPSTERVRVLSDLSCLDKLSQDDIDHLLFEISECNKFFENLKTTKSLTDSAELNNDSLLSLEDEAVVDNKTYTINSMKHFRCIIADVKKVRNSTEKQVAVFRKLFNDNNVDRLIWIKLLLPATSKWTAKLETSALIAIFARLLDIQPETFSTYLAHYGCDLGYALSEFVKENETCKTVEKSTVTLYDVKDMLKTLSTLSTEDDFVHYFKEVIIPKCNVNDLKFVIRLTQHELKMHAGAEQIFKAIDDKAFRFFMKCKNIEKTLAQFTKAEDTRKRKTKPAESFFKKKLKEKSPVEDLPSSSGIVDIPVSQDSSMELQDDSMMVVEAVEIPQNDTIELQEVPPESSIVESLPEETVINDSLQDPLEELQEEGPLQEQLPNQVTNTLLFQNEKLLLDEHVANFHSQWIEAFCHHGGILLRPEQNQEATYVLHLYDTVSELTVPCNITARHVIVEWIKDSIANQKVQDYRQYTVRWDPIESD